MDTLIEALESIIKIENQLYGDSWDEIDDARSIAEEALKEFYSKKNQLT